MQETFKRIIEILEDERELSYADFEAYAEEHYLDADYDDFFSKGIERATKVIEEEGKRYNNGWIPCRKKLPEVPHENPDFDNRRLELYLVSVKGRNYSFRAFWNGKYFADGFSKVDNVVAWQPLPEKYIEQEEYHGQQS